MTDLIAKQQEDGSFHFFDPLEDTEEPMTVLPNLPGDARVVVDWLSSGLGMDVQIVDD